MHTTSHLTLTHTHTQQQDEEHERYFKYLTKIDPDFTNSITHFIVLDTPRLVHARTHIHTQITDNTLTHITGGGGG